jgi:hypothetical protein
VLCVNVYTQSVGTTNGMFNGIRGIPLPAEKWVLALRKGVNSRDAKTTGASEGWHRSFKQLLLFYCPQMHMRRLDHLLHLLFTQAKCKVLVRQLARDTGVTVLPSVDFRVCVHMSYGHPSSHGRATKSSVQSPCKRADLFSRP